MFHGMFWQAVGKVWFIEGVMGVRTTCAIRSLRECGL